MESRLGGQRRAIINRDTEGTLKMRGVIERQGIQSVGLGLGGDTNSTSKDVCALESMSSRHRSTPDKSDHA
jgi:hypothetical protein